MTTNRKTLAVLVCYILSACLPSWGAIYQNKVGYSDAGLTVYNNTWIRHRITVTGVGAGIFKPGGTVSLGITNGSGDAGSSATATVDANGVLPTIRVVQYLTASPHGNANLTISNVSAAITQSNANAQAQTVTIAQTQRVNVQADLGGNPKIIDIAVTVPIYPLGFQFGEWNVQLSTRSRRDAPVNYALQWAGEQAQMFTVPASVTRDGAVNLWTRTRRGLEDPTTAKAFTLYRQIAGGDWVVYKTGTVAFNGIAYIYDDPSPDSVDYGTPEGGSTSGLTDTAITLDPKTGTPTGATQSTAGNGYTSAGSSGGGGGGGGSTTITGTVTVSGSVTITNVDDFYTPVKNATKDAMEERSDTEAAQVAGLPLPDAEAVDAVDLGTTAMPDVKAGAESLLTTAENGKTALSSKLGALKAKVDTLPTSITKAATLEMGSYDFNGSPFSVSIPLTTGPIAQTIPWVRQMALFITSFAFIYAMFNLFSRAVGS